VLGEGVTVDEGGPQIVLFTYDGTRLTFRPEPVEEMSYAMTATVERDGSTIVMRGVLTGQSSGFSVKAEFEVTKKQ
jgi:hypothetical protein